MPLVGLVVVAFSIVVVIVVKPVINVIVVGIVIDGGDVVGQIIGDRCLRRHRAGLHRAGRAGTHDRIGVLNIGGDVGQFGVRQEA